MDFGILTGGGDALKGEAYGLGCNTDVYNSYNEGNVLVNLDLDCRNKRGLACGLDAGFDFAETKNCYNLGSITTSGGVSTYNDTYAYGLTTGCYGSWDFFNVYNTGDVTSTEGYAYGTTGHLYYLSGEQGTIVNTGKVSGKKGAFGNNACGNLPDSYYLSGQVYVNGVQKEDDEYARTQEEMNTILKPVLEVVNTEVTFVDTYYDNTSNSFVEVETSTSNAFVEDTNNINNGLPILKWQVEH